MTDLNVAAAGARRIVRVTSEMWGRDARTSGPVAQEVWAPMQLRQYLTARGGAG